PKSQPAPLEQAVHAPLDELITTTGLTPPSGLNSSRELGRARPKEDLLMDEIRQMKEMMARLSSQISEAPLYPEEIIKYKERLLEHEIEADLVERILRLATEDFVAEDSPRSEENAYAAIRKQLHDLL